jgi:hypothetical protein
VNAIPTDWPLTTDIIGLLDFAIDITISTIFYKPCSAYSIASTNYPFLITSSKTDKSFPLEKNFPP